MNYFDYLNYCSSRQIYEAIKHEQQQTAALILLHISTQLSAEVLTLFPVKTRAEIAMKMAEAGEVPDSLLKNLSDSLQEKISPSTENLGGIKFVAEVLKKLDK